MALKALALCGDFVSLHYVDCPCPPSCLRRDGVRTCAPDALVTPPLLSRALLLSPPLLPPSLCFFCVWSGSGVAFVVSVSGFCLVALFPCFCCVRLLLFSFFALSLVSHHGCATKDCLSGYHPRTAGSL